MTMCSAGEHGLTCWHQSAAIASAVQRCAAKATPAPEPTPALSGAEIDRRMAAAFR